jgi:hypothetical protein
MGSMLPYIAAPWILWVILCFAKQFTQHVDSQPTNFSGPLMSIVFRGKVRGGSSHFLWYQWGTCNGILRAMAGMREDYICYPCIHSGLRSCLDMFSISTSIFWCTGCHDYPWSIAKSKADYLCDSGWFHPVGSGAVENFLRWDVQSFFFPVPDARKLVYHNISHASLEKLLLYLWLLHVISHFPLFLIIVHQTRCPTWSFYRWNHVNGPILCLLDRQLFMKYPRATCVR